MNHGEIELNNLSIRLKDKIIFKNLNHIFNRTTLNFIVGENGSGKSTLIKALNRIIKVDNGSIFVDGKDINDISVEWLREKVSINFQQNQFISNLIKDHLKFNTDFDSKNYSKAMSKIRKYINSSIGDVSLITELSGGKRQLISLYSSLCLNPDVLILDESFSNIDKQTTNFILKTLRELKSEITIIIITHDTSLINEDDNVLNLSKKIEV
ncbi:ATP-binding cassette domain-containing protein [Oceanobacillus bengalensis]|uniref:ATP-binding cassette domain-containing protein n=1 Tax=Oceanobacillus bengalensis TaxID=1435466 RepID=A0A494Z1Y5_9BACI|nr:ATP-binding cassette domain-containing protein [Oceanobacillus bengalensis]RKQ16540.1 ATP-binding cassette domain-containing protein [Oceanobacillus bengalensis]